MKCPWTSNDFLNFLTYCGHKENIAELECCSTRLRIKFVDSAIIQKEKFSLLPKVKTILESGSELQLVIGLEAYSIFKECKKYELNFY